MELEKTLTVAAPVPRVWGLLLDPGVMAGCVPGTGAVEVVSDVEYLAEITVKISFVAARFRVRTTIVEARAPHYLRIEGTGEDRSVASSMRQTSELFLTDLGGDRTEIRIKAKAEVLGRLGSFGLSVMKTKADRMWEEFGANFAALAERDGAAPSVPDQPPAIVSPAAPDLALADGIVPPRAPPDPLPPGSPSPDSSSPDSSSPGALPREPRPSRARWWQRIVGAGAAGAELPAVQRLPTDIYIELPRGNGVVKVLWPASAAAEAARWLKEMP